MIKIYTERIRTTSINSAFVIKLVTSDDFKKFIEDTYDDSYSDFQISCDISNAINMVTNGARLAVTPMAQYPEQEAEGIIINLNGNLFDITNGHYICEDDCGGISIAYARQGYDHTNASKDIEIRDYIRCQYIGSKEVGVIGVN